MTAAVSTEGLVKRYPGGSGNAVDELSIEVPAGETVGVLGPNGAGKTTLIKMLCGVSAPTAGRVGIFGADPADSRVRREIAAVHQTLTFDLMLSGLDNLRIGAAFRGLRWREVRGHVDRLLTAFDLTGCVDRLVFTLSGGQQRRLQVVRALLRVPRLLLLDEPSAGLDVAGRRQVWQLLADIRAEHGTTTLWTSHQLDEIERNCGRVLVLHRGRLLQYGSPRALVDRFGQTALRLTPADPADAGRILVVAERLGLLGRSDVDAVELTGPRAGDRLPVLLAALRDGGLDVAAVEVRRASLEDVFMKLTDAVVPVGSGT